MRDCHLADQEYAAQVQCHCAVPFLDRHVLHRCKLFVAAGAVDDDVDAAERLDDAGDALLDRGDVGDVRIEQLSTAASGGDGGGNLAAVFGINVHDGNLAALRGKQSRSFRADALRRAGDQRNAVLEFGVTGHHDFSLFSAATAALRLIHDPQPMTAAQVQKIAATPPTAAPMTPNAGGTNTCAP